MSIAYILVALTYLGIGATFYLTFPLEKDCIEDVIKIFDSLLRFQQIYLFSYFFPEFIEQFFAIRYANCYSSRLSPLSNDDGLSVTRLHPENSDSVCFL